MPVHGGSADSDLKRWPAGNEPHSDYKKGSSDYPETGKYVDKGGFIPEGEIPDPNGQSPLDILLAKEAGELGEEVVDASVIDDEARLEVARKAAKLKAKGEPKKIRIVKKEKEDLTNKSELDSDYEELENMPRQQGRSQSLRERYLSYSAEKRSRQSDEKGKTEKRKGWLRRFFGKMRENKERPQDQL